MTGGALPEAVLKSLLQGSKSGGLVSVVNLTPYDACLEKTCVQFHSKSPAYTIRSLSLSTDVGVTNYCERTIALFLMEDPLCFSGQCLGFNELLSSWGGTYNRTQNYTGFNQKSHGCHLDSWQDWKADSTYMGDVRRYDPNPPAKEEVDASRVSLKLAQVVRDPSKHGWNALKITLSNEVRSLHLGHAVFGGQWRDLILDFDRKFPK